MANKKKTTKATKPEQSKAKEEIKETEENVEAAEKEAPKKEAPKKEAAKKEAAKKDAPKKDAPKKDSKAKKSSSTEATGVKKVFGRIKQFFKDVKSETKKIVWNTWPNTIKDTGVVLMVTVVIGAGVWICDLLFRQLVELIYSLAGSGAADAAMIALQNLTTLL